MYVENLLKILFLAKYLNDLLKKGKIKKNKNKNWCSYSWLGFCRCKVIIWNCFNAMSTIIEIERFKKECKKFSNKVKCSQYTTCDLI
jgi:hypothetical protein